MDNINNNNNSKKSILHFESFNKTENNTVKITGVASYDYSENKRVISFREGNPEYFESTTVISLEDDSRVSIKRDGKYGMLVHAEKNKPNVSSHSTPYGTFSTSIRLTDLKSDLGPDGGTLNFTYVARIDLHIVSEISISIKIKTMQNSN